MRTILKIALLFLTALLLVICCCAQSPPSDAAADPAPAALKAEGIWDVITDPNNITPAAFLLSNLADAKTDWRFTGPITHKEYTITPAQRLGIVGGSIFVAYTIRHYYPRTAKPINVVMAIATAYFAGRAYANTFNHGTPALGPPVADPGAKIAFAVHLRR